MTKLTAILRRRWPLIAALTLLGIAAGMLSAALLSSPDDERGYRAEQVIVANPTSGANPLVTRDELKVTRGEVPTRAAEALGAPDDADRLAGRISTQADEAAGSITVSTTDGNPDRAVARVEAFVTAFLEVTNDELQADERRQYDRVVEDLAAAIDELAQFDAANPSIADPPSAGLPPGSEGLVGQRRDIETRVTQLSEDARNRELALTRAAPYESLGPEAPRRLESGLVSVPDSVPVRGALVGLLGLLLGVVLTVVLEKVNPRVDSRDDLVTVTDLPILAEIGHVPPKRRSHHDDGTVALDGLWAEPYRRVRSAIQFVQAGGGDARLARPRADGRSADEAEVEGEGDVIAGPTTFLVTSTAPGEGKSTSSALIAMALAELGQRTVVVGGDFRRPGVEKLLGQPTGPTIEDLAVLDVARPSIGDVVHPTRAEHLYLAPAGKGTREVAPRLRAARQLIDIVGRSATVIVDSSPLNAANDTVDLLPVVDHVILVVRAGRAPATRVAESLELLARMDAQVLGLILIGTTTAGRRQSYYYDYYDPKRA